MKDRRYLPTWRTEKAERRYRQADAELWRRDLTRTRPETIDLPTSFGSTRAYRWPGDGQPVVFLHGMGDTSIRWIPYAEGLSGHEVYAIDIMGDVGASRPTVGFTSADDYGDWLDQAIDGLGVASPVVVGHSLGGFVALSYARSHPVTSMVLFDPVGMVELRLARFMAMGLGGLVAAISPGPLRRLLARRLHHPLLLDKAGLRLYIRGQRDHPPKLPPLPVFTDDELASISAPVQVLVGAETFVFDVDHLVERAATTMPSATTRLLPGAGHALTMTHLDECLTTVRAALSAGTVR